MNTEYLLNLIGQGENSNIEFKIEEARPENIAREMVAFSNHLGGVLLIGVTDEGKIVGISGKDLEEKIANIARENVVPAINYSAHAVNYEDKKVFIVEIEKGQHKPYQTIDGKYWIRVGSTNRMATQSELMRLFQQSGMLHFDINPVERTHIKSLNFDKIHHYFELNYQVEFANMEEQEQVRLLYNSDILMEENNQVSVSGVLMFGKNPERYLPQATISFAAFKGVSLDAELTLKKEISGTLDEQIESASSLVQLHLPNESTIEGLKRVEQTLIPKKVLRELIVNAVAHRNYAITSRRIQILLFSDRLEITSPGRIPNTLTIEKIKTGNSALRNPAIIKYLDNLRYIDALGRGIPMIIRQMGDKVAFSEEGELFKVVIRFI
ncbi:MAG: RNA-binding domain-containing protein [Candidatus Cyclobacteriaceae bacterium M3_2C_046]